MLPIYYTADDVTFPRELDFNSERLESLLGRFFNNCIVQRVITHQHLQRLEVSEHVQKRSQVC